MSDFVTVASVEDIPPGEGQTVEADGKEIALFNIEGDFYALDNICTHAGGPLGEGEVHGKSVVCPWHGAEFDCETGDFLSPPAPGPVKTYDVKVENDEVKISVD